jgi:hypothetical protein
MVSSSFQGNVQFSHPNLQREGLLEVVSTAMDEDGDDDEDSRSSERWSCLLLVRQDAKDRKGKDKVPQTW